MSQVGFHGVGWQFFAKSAIAVARHEPLRRVGIRSGRVEGSVARRQWKGAALPNILQKSRSCVIFFSLALLI